MTARRYRLRLATWTVVREPGAPSPWTLSSPAAVAELAQDLLREHDDDKEHFWAIYLNAQNHYLMHTLVSLVSRLLVLNFGRKLDDGVPAAVLANPTVQEVYLGMPAT